jgi:hypothetical protein
MDNIRSGLESHLATLTNVLKTEYESVSFTPQNDVAYQSCYVLRAETDDLNIAYDEKKRFNGIFQVTLRFPTGQGSGGAESEALRIIEHFKRSTIINKNDIQIRVQKSPTMKNLGILDDRLLVAVSIVYEAYNIV